MYYGIKPWNETFFLDFSKNHKYFRLFWGKGVQFKPRSSSWNNSHKTPIFSSLIPDTVQRRKTKKIWKGASYTVDGVRICGNPLQH